jgi:hypothetical protein
MFDAFPTGKRGQEAAETEDVIEVSVGDEDASESTKANPRPEDLALGPFAAVDQESMVAKAHHL